jgi:hypothetical protein
MREELGDVISMIDRDETPGTSWMGSGTAGNTIAHSWETVSLRAPRRSPTAEGNVATNSTPKVATKLTNACEIIQEQYALSGTVQAANIAGGAGKMDWQRMLKGKELRKDLEIAVFGPQDDEVADPREMAGVQAFTPAAQANVGTGGTAPDGVGDTAVVFGTEQTLDLDLILAEMQTAWVNGGRISLLFLSGAQKLAFDTVAPVDSIAEAQVDITNLEGATVVTTVAVWKSTFGQVKFVMDSVLDEQGGWGQQVILGFDERRSYRPKICPLPGRNWLVEKLGKRGDLDEELMTWEGTLEVPNPKSLILIGALSDAYAS